MLIVVSYGLPILALLGAALVRWRHRAFFVVRHARSASSIAVGAHPYDDPTPLGRLFKGFAEASTRARAAQHRPRGPAGRASASRCCSASA